MRETKFRAWHKAFRKMYYDIHVHPESWTDNSTHFGGEHDTLMQFTGLHDKNGKEIWEGDIWQGNTKKYVVKFDIGQFKFMANDGNWMPIIEVCKEIKIIGNIYEKPELLKDYNARTRNGST